MGICAANLIAKTLKRKPGNKLKREKKFLNEEMRKSAHPATSFSNSISWSLPFSSCAVAEKNYDTKRVKHFTPCLFSKPLIKIYMTALL
jgi:hypothetical protein